MNQDPTPSADLRSNESAPAPDLLDNLAVVFRGWQWVAAATVAGILAGYAASHLLPKGYTAHTILLPPQQQGGAATSVLATLGPLAALSGGNLRTPADQYIGLMRSETVGNRMVERFNLVALYHARLKADARGALESRVRISSGKKDGLILIEVDDALPERAAEMANAYVEELRRLTAQLAMTEAQVRRVFFEGKLKQARDALSLAQLALQSSGISEATVRSEPRSAVDAFARLSTEVAALEVRLQLLRASMAEGSTEVRQVKAALDTSRSQLARLQAEGDGDRNGYSAKYRDLKYQEALFEVYSRQYEAARLDEARDNTVIQVVDPALPPELPTAPRKLRIAAVAGLASALLCMFVLSRRRRWARAARH